MKINLKGWIKENAKILYEANNEARLKLKAIYFYASCKYDIKLMKNCKEKKAPFNCGLNSLQEANQEASFILCHCLNIDRAKIYYLDDYEISQEQAFLLENFVNRRKNKEPFALIVGKKCFYDLEFMVNEHTLIPRPETEFLVEEGILYIQQNNLTKSCLMADFGCGTACIGLSVLNKFKNAKCLFVDISDKALEVAKKNASELGLSEQCIFMHADFTSPNFSSEIQQILISHKIAEKNSSALKFNLIFSNPPYITEKEYARLDFTVKNFEPKQALLSKDKQDNQNEDKGLFHIADILKIADKLLPKNGLLLMEHGYKQGQDILNFMNNFSWQHFEIKKDYAQNDRYLKAVK